MRLRARPPPLPGHRRAATAVHMGGGHPWLRLPLAPLGPTHLAAAALAATQWLQGVEWSRWIGGVEYGFVGMACAWHTHEICICTAYARYMHRIPGPAQAHPSGRRAHLLLGAVGSGKADYRTLAQALTLAPALRYPPSPSPSPALALTLTLTRCGRRSTRRRLR